MDLFTGIDWTACRILNVAPVHAVASEILQKTTASTQFYQFGVKFHGYTDIYYNHCHLVFNTGSILYLPKEKSKSIPYDKIIRQDGDGVCIFFDSLHPLAEKPAVFSPSEQTLPLEQFSRLLHIWQQENNDLSSLAIFYQILSALKRLTYTDPVSRSLRYRLQAAAEYMDLHRYEKFPDLKKLASLCGLSPEYFRQCFRNAYGVTPLQYLNRAKLQHSQELLVTTDLTVTEISGICGFDGLNYFSRFFKQHTGMTPSRYRILFRQQI